MDIKIRLAHRNHMRKYHWTKCQNCDKIMANTKICISHIKLLHLSMHYLFQILK